jgi:hypothetical protein
MSVSDSMSAHICVVECLRVYMYVCTYICIDIYYINTYTHTHTHTHTHMDVPMASAYHGCACMHERTPHNQRTCAHTHTRKNIYNSLHTPLSPIFPGNGKALVLFDRILMLVLVGKLLVDDCLLLDGASLACACLFSRSRRLNTLCLCMRMYVYICIAVTVLCFYCVLALKYIQRHAHTHTNTSACRILAGTVHAACCIHTYLHRHTHTHTCTHL